MPFDVRRFDIYRKVPKDLTQPTYTGAFMVGLDIQDEMGRHEVGHIDNSMKIPLNQGDGCRFEGEFTINKVPGNFHVSTHSATAQPQSPDMTHTIHKLAFGEKLQVQKVQGAFNALGGADRLASNRTYARGTFTHRSRYVTFIVRRPIRQTEVLLPVHGSQQGAAIIRLSPFDRTSVSYVVFALVVEAARHMAGACIAPLTCALTGSESSPLVTGNAPLDVNKP
ncbi:Endoplasmic reticulum-Golgi intermediate compartment protein 1 [Larimichthys crocea]|uniref:Uncharacterized protein n=1 Tax=Larimichthys crocea TaxID=215358 RepID=A0ACD3RDD1_LARCR|nr:Endoplasmic reticulum-Golgi intermediate compartment protein 1 [Larimichthys crocea]